MWNEVSSEITCTTQGTLLPDTGAVDQMPRISDKGDKQR